MEVFITRVPSHTNKIELKIFLRDFLHSCDILAFEVNKVIGKNWATVALPDEVKGTGFLQRFGFVFGKVAQVPLIFQGSQLILKRSNKRDRPSAIQVKALMEADSKARSNLSTSLTSQATTISGQPLYKISSMRTGIWLYDSHGRLNFDVRTQDPRQGTVTFGNKSLVLYLSAVQSQDCNWHCRIDISYSILEHAILSGGGQIDSAITLTLKTPPKFFEIRDKEDLHRYTGTTQMLETLLLMGIQSLHLGKVPEKKRLGRLCKLSEKHDKSSALCMVYQIRLPNAHSARSAWSHIKRNSALGDKDLHRLNVPAGLRRPIEADFSDFQKELVAAATRPSNALGFEGRVQILALVLEGTLSPWHGTQLLQQASQLANEHGGDATALAIQQFGFELPTPGPSLTPGERASFRPTTFDERLRYHLQSSETIDITSKDLIKKRKKSSELARTFKATITPTGLFIRGPDWHVSNRVLRRYPKHWDYFIRVNFTDEDGVFLMYDQRADQNDVYNRFKKVLNEGVGIAERHYQFLGFSHSSLRDHTAWFMAPFYYNEELVFPQRIIKELGNFTHIHVAAKCAARIGQAFTDTSFAVRLPKHTFVEEKDIDVARNGRCFSDGCGRISKDLLHKIWQAFPQERHQRQPKVLQIRYRGAKGVVSLDSRLQGFQLLIRESMTKFEAGASWNDIEICEASYKPLTMFLNHQYVKILEDLGVPIENFHSVLQDAVETLKAIVLNPINAANFLDYSFSGTAAKIPSLFLYLNDIGLSFQADQFLTDMVIVAALQAVRDLKYRARIPLEKGILLFGVMDEFNELDEGEVYVSTRTKDGDRERKFVLVQDRVAITRAPALHPGDIQVVRAVDVPKHSPLKMLDNCIVFSQRGKRDLPSQLSGGDLDGDKFHIIYDKRLIPPQTTVAADYAAAPAKDLGRPIKTQDIVDFFIEYMQSDRLGQISNMHKVKADNEASGTLHHDSCKLAELASLAVDYTKSGNPVNMTEVPKGPYHIRPDFMSPSSGIVLKEKEVELEGAEMEDLENPDSVNILDPDKQSIRYYRSDKALGQLFRSIDEFKFFQRMKDDFQASRHALGDSSLMNRLETYIDRETRFWQWDHYRQFAEELREYYEENMLDIMHSLRPHRGQALTELEVFSGNILGKKERAPSRAVKEAKIAVQERFNRDVSAIILRIVKGEGLDDNEDEALPRAVACFKISLETQGWENYVELVSWQWVCAAVVLERLCIENDFRLRPL